MNHFYPHRFNGPRRLTPAGRLLLWFVACGAAVVAVSGVLL